LSSGQNDWEPWLDERAVASHYGVSTRTIRRWRASGMPSRAFGGVRRYRLSECEQWHQQPGAA
jgi:DNA-binding transcriptional MerR regulator